jgi:hypothetical protein
MNVGFGRNHREDDDGEEAEVEVKDQESEGGQKSRPGAEKEEISGKERRGQKVGRKEVEGQEDGVAEEVCTAQEDCLEACSTGSRANRSGLHAVLVALRVELRR